MLIYKIGDVLNSGESIVVHGCNCKKAMGSGIARQVREQCPNAYAADQSTLWADRNKLGRFTYAIEKNGMIVVNAYTQYDYTRTKVDVDYSALNKVFHFICEEFPDHKVISMPKIGCGLAGGDWKIVSEILDRVSDEYGKSFRVYVLDSNELTK